MWQVVTGVLAQAWRQFADQSLAILPNVLASLLFLIVGVALTVAAGRAARFLLRRSAVERKASRIGLTAWLERAGILSATAAMVRAVQMLFALMTAALVLYAMDAALAADLTRRFFVYVPDLVIGVGILVLGLLASRVVGRSVLIGAVNHGFGAARLLATLTQAGIVILSGAVALDQLGIGRSIVPHALLVLLAGATLATSLAIGLGSRDAVSRWINDRFSRPAPPDADELQHW